VTSDNGEADGNGQVGEAARGPADASDEDRGVSPIRLGTVVMDPDEDIPPGAVLEAAAACVRFVLTKYKIELAFERDTLSLVDHYVEEARASVAGRPEALALLARAVGAYLGEVVRRIHVCWWRIDHADAGAWRLEFRDVYLCFYPVQVAYAALTRAEDESSFAGFEMPEEDRAALLDRLDHLPPIRESEYFAPSTRVEVLDIAVDALLARRARDPIPTRPYVPSDYEG
jgi:hypothetical protein